MAAICCTAAWASFSTRRFLPFFSPSHYEIPLPLQVLASYTASYSIGHPPSILPDSAGAGTPGCTDVIAVPFPSVSRVTLCRNGTTRLVWRAQPFPAGQSYYSYRTPPAIATDGALLPMLPFKLQVGSGTFIATLSVDVPSLALACSRVYCRHRLRAAGFIWLLTDGQRHLRP